MTAGVKPRVKVPKTAAIGDVIVIKTLISHKMESGQRKDSDGKTIPRKIINRFVCDFNSQNVIDVNMQPSISTNPFFQFEMKIMEAGTFQFTWYDDDGDIYETTKDIAIA